MPENEPFDRVIDSALSSYGDSKAGPELAQRVLVRIASEAALRRRWMLWAIALPVAAGLLLLAVFFAAKPGGRPVENAEQAHPSRKPATVAHVEPAVAPRSAPPEHKNARSQQPHRSLAAAAATPAPLPKLDVFPTPEPLTPAEQALVEFAARAPQAERKALVEAQQQIGQPLSIAAIKIPPLEPAESQDN